MSYACTINEPITMFVYRNLNQKCWSVKAVDREHKGRVIFHSMALVIKNAHFKVGNGRFRVRTNKRKNVHAGVVGTLMLASRVTPRYDLSDYGIDVGRIVEPNEVYDLKLGENSSYHRVTYNPHTMDNFKYADTMEDVTSKNLTVVLDFDMKAYVYDPNRGKS